MQNGIPESLHHMVAAFQGPIRRNFHIHEITGGLFAVACIKTVNADMVAQGQPVDNHVRLHIGKILPRRFDMDDDVRFRQFMLYNAFNGFRHIMGVIHVQFRRRFHIQLYEDARASVTQADAFDRIIRGILFHGVQHLPRQGGRTAVHQGVDGTFGKAESHGTNQSRHKQGRNGIRPLQEAVPG